MAIKNVTGSEEFFEGHFPGAPVMPGRAAHGGPGPGGRDLAAPGRRRPAAGSRSTWSASTTPSSAGRSCPATSSASRCSVLHRRGALVPRAGRGARAASTAWRRRACSCRWPPCPAPQVDPTARVVAGAVLGAGRARRALLRGRARRCALGAGTVVDSHVVIDGDTRVGRAATTSIPFSSVGPGPAGPEVPRRAHAPRDRRPQHLPRVRDRAPRAPRAGAASPASAPTTCSWPTPTSPTTARWAATRSSPTAPPWPATWRSQD